MWHRATAAVVGWHLQLSHACGELLLGPGYGLCGSPDQHVSYICALFWAVSQLFPALQHVGHHALLRGDDDGHCIVVRVVCAARGWLCHRSLDLGNTDYERHRDLRGAVAGGGHAGH